MTFPIIKPPFDLEKAQAKVQAAEDELNIAYDNTSYKKLYYLLPLSK